MRTPRILLMAGLLVLAGCFHGDDGTGPPPTSSTDPAASAYCAGLDAPSFEATENASGANALAVVVAISCDFTTEPPRPLVRVPGTDDHAAAVDWLVDALEARGARVARETFTGAAYQALDHGGVSFYSSSCPQEERERVAGLTFTNVVAEFGQGDDVYYLMAHHDAKRFADDDPDPERRDEPVPAANDGGSGVGVLVEVARVRADAGLPFTVRILLTDGEDGFEDCHPLAGSIYHARGLDDAAKDRVRGVVLLDMVGDADAAYCLAGNAAGLRDALRAAAARAGAEAVQDAPACSVLDDHTPFMEEGLDAVDLIDFNRPQTGFPPYWHTTGDTPDKLDASMLEAVARTVTAFLDAAA